MSLHTIKGKALVTGASSGIGATYAERLASRGFDLLLVARDLSRLESMAARLSQAYGVKVEVLKADLTSKADIQAVAQRLRSDGAISLLVNNAGVAMNGSLAEADLDQVDGLIQLNIVALTHLAAAAAATFSAAGRGGIINIASVVALAPEMFNAVYSASKAYVLSLTQTLHGEIGKQGVQLQAVCPGVTRTEIWERSGMDEKALPPEMIMEVGEMVDAALAGFDQGELITIPSLPDAADWNALVSARGKLGPNLSRNSAAARYK
ncbi:MAG: SDR family oxidoreductase [Pseudomonas sp.]